MRNEEFEFSLRFRLPADCPDYDVLVERLYEAGCNDATIGIGLPGYIGLDFIREASSAEEAVVSAISDVLNAIPRARLVEAAPDFVGLTDVAEMVGVTRQNMRKLMVNHPEKFPAPVHGGSASIWHLASVLQFLQERDYDVRYELYEVARAAMKVNIAKEHASLGKEAEKLRQLFA
ncbi:DNA-binding protein [Ramlibacter tataouinensis]|uniref:DNA-binding protein n=1 Tax=Ramlibacter tataouinensis TaxID=94132 RepID=UPI0022F3EAC0|nr:DNA-binding protein [Ramlibacter tataouinensis]WBY02783.1 DNA-binding protein [Ramlibacter tataouinensis]